MEGKAFSSIVAKDRVCFDDEGGDVEESEAPAGESRRLKRMPGCRNTLAPAEGIVTYVFATFGLT